MRQLQLLYKLTLLFTLVLTLNIEKSIAQQEATFSSATVLVCEDLEESSFDNLTPKSVESETFILITEYTDRPPVFTFVVFNADVKSDSWLAVLQLEELLPATPNQSRFDKQTFYYTQLNIDNPQKQIVSIVWDTMDDSIDQINISGLEGDKIADFKGLKHFNEINEKGVWLEMIDELFEIHRAYISSP